MPIQLYSEQLDQPTHRFDYANPGDTHDIVGKGLGQYGPFDSSTSREFTEAKFSIVYPKSWESHVKRFTKALVRGCAPFFSAGFREFFRMETFNADNAIGLPNDSLGSYLEGVEEVRARDDDFALVFVSSKMRDLGYRSPYWAMKAVLTEAGVPSQMVMIDRLQSGSSHHVPLKYLIVNIANQIYAKLGGTPWVVHRPDSPVDLIVGVGKSVYQEGRVGDTRRTLGFASAYQSNGAFLWYDSTEITSSDSSLEEQLTRTITSTVRECAQREGRPQNVVVHSYKRLGPSERQAKHRLEDEYDDLEVTLAHLNDSHNYRIYDSSHETGLSQRGLWIRTGENKGFVMTGGRRQYSPGTPIPIDMTTEGDTPIQSIAQGVFDLCEVYWKDQFGASMPITIKYAEDIADIFENAQRMSDEGLIDVNLGQLVNPQLKRVPWFL
jgi:hypothetical protein